MKHLIGFMHRVAYATALSFLCIYTCSIPQAFGKHEALQKVVCYTLNYPTAVVGLVTRPYRGMDVFFDRGDEWCDFCSMQQVYGYHLRFAIPVYVLLFYVPTFIMWMIRRSRQRVEKAGATSLLH